MWKHIIEPGRPQMTVWPTRIACWTPKATEYLIFIAFLLQQWWHEHACMYVIRTLPVLFILITVNCN